MMEILKNQKGQGTWEYMVIMVGIAVVAVAVSAGLKSGITGETGITGKMTGKLDALADGIELE